jgi:hypothetical protein
MNAATLRLLIEKGLSPEDLIAVAEAMETKRDNTAAERQARHRAKSRSVRNAVTSRRDPPIEEIIPPLPPSLAKANDCPPFAVRIVSAWNEAAKGTALPQARPLDAGRQAKLRLRAKEHGEDGLLDAIRRICASPFHRGENDRGWKASLGWLLKSSENVGKALDLDPAPSDQSCSVDPLEAAERSAALYRRMGRDEDAKLAERRAERLRQSATGPPQPIAKIIGGLDLASNG